jgi:hypothetical protein
MLPKRGSTEKFSQGRSAKSAKPAAATGSARRRATMVATRRSAAATAPYDAINAARSGHPGGAIPPA